MGGYGRLLPLIDWRRDLYEVLDTLEFKKLVQNNLRDYNFVSLTAVSLC